MRRTNEGTCCDAVLRILEERDGITRSNYTFPERIKDHQAPVDLVCEIGSKRYAVEHTKLQSYLQQIQDTVCLSNALGRLETTPNQLPTSAWFWLAVPPKSFDGHSRKKAKAIGDSIAEWVIEKAPTIKIPLHGWSDLIDRSFDGVRVELGALVGSPAQSLGKLKIVRNAPQGLDGLRKESLNTALENKLPKLEWWANDGALTVLIFESNDPSLSNHHFTFNDLKQQLIGKYCPTFIFYVYAIDSPWTIYMLLADGSFPVPSDYWPCQAFEVSALTDVTNVSRKG